VELAPKPSPAGESQNFHLFSLLRLSVKLQFQFTWQALCQACRTGEGDEAYCNVGGNSRTELSAGYENNREVSLSCYAPYQFWFTPSNEGSKRSSRSTATLRSNRATGVRGMAPRGRTISDQNPKSEAPNPKQTEAK